MKKLCKGIISLFAVVCLVVIEPAQSVAAYTPIKINLPFNKDGYRYNQMTYAEDTPVTNTSDESEIVEGLFNRSFFSGTDNTPGRQWMAIARMAYASKFGSDGTRTYLDTSGEPRKMAFKFIDRPTSNDKMATATSTKDDRLYQTNLYDANMEPLQAETAYAKNSELALDQMMKEITAANYLIGYNKSDYPEEWNPDHVTISAEDRDKIISTEGIAAYQWYGNYWRNGSDDYGGGNGVTLGILFNNIKMTPILPDGIGITSSSPGTGDNKTQESTGVFNATSSEVEVSQSLEESHTDTASNSISKSTSLQFSEGFEISKKTSASLSLESILSVGTETTSTFSFSSQQAFETAWSNQNEISDTTSTTRTVAITLPAYTKVNLKQKKDNLDTTVTYDCPVYLTYDAYIIVFTRTPNSKDTGRPRSEVICSFKGDAAKNFSERFLGMGASSDDDKIIWNDGLRGLYASQEPIELHYFLLGGDAINNLNYKEYDATSSFTADLKKKSLVYKRLGWMRPAIMTGGSLRYTRTGVSYLLDGISPYYPLTKVSTGDTKEYNLIEGDTLNVDTIPLYGNNRLGGKFYGFQGEKGTWKLVDESGHIITESENGVASLKTNAVSGYQYLKAKSEGTIYLRYTPNKSDYEKEMVTDTATLTIPVNVAAQPEILKKYKVKATGTLDDVKKDEPIDLNTADGIKAYVEDEDGYIITNILQWKAKDQTGTSGITIDSNNQMTITRPGTYEVKPFYKNGSQTITSENWITVCVKGAEKPEPIKTPIPITGIMPEDRVLDAAGGKVKFTLIGEELKDGIQVRAGSYRGWTTGGNTVQKATIYFPANKSKTKEKVYRVQYSFDGITFYDTTAAVTVKNVKPAKLKIVTAKGNGKVQVRWARNTDATGYQVQFAMDKKFKNERKTITINRYQTTKLVKKLKRGTKYYVRVRCYEKNGRKNLYGSWSKVKPVEVR